MCHVQCLQPSSSHDLPTPSQLYVRGWLWVDIVLSVFLAAVAMILIVEELFRLYWKGSYENLLNNNVPNDP